MLAAGIYSEKSEYDSLFISNYIDVYVKDALKRIPGVSDVLIFGERKYSMRLWLDPGRLAARQLTAGDVVGALSQQNAQVAAGALGQEPAPQGQMYQISVRVQGRLQEATDFDNIILKSGADGSLVRVKDVGYTELGAETYSADLRFQGVPAVGFGVIQLPTANALDVASAIEAELTRLEAFWMAKGDGTVDKMKGFAEQCMAEYDLDGWTVPDLINPDDINVVLKNLYGQ